MIKAAQAQYYSYVTTSNPSALKPFPSKQKLLHLMMYAGLSATAMWTQEALSQSCSGFTSGGVVTLSSSDVCNYTSSTPISRRHSILNPASVNNAGQIATNAGDFLHIGIANFGNTISNITNSGTIGNANVDGSGTQNGIRNDSRTGVGTGDSVITSIINTGRILGGNGGIYMTVGSVTGGTNLIGSIDNAGTITGTNFGIYSTASTSRSGVINSIINRSGSTISGLITNSAFFGFGILLDGISTTGTITNDGTITGYLSGIKNVGTLTTLNNAQGGNSATPARTALTYTGNLPTNYNIIIASASNYGQLAVTSGTGSMNFGIYTGGVTGIAASTLSTGRYLSVLTGVNASNLNGTYTNQIFGNYKWSLVNTSGSIWDLDVTLNGPPSDDTQKSIVATAASLQDTFALQNAVLSNSLGYDCNEFGNNGVCISTGGRHTTVSASNGLKNSNALLIAAYRLNQNYRIGAYADQNLSVNNAGTTVRLGNNTPLIGLFGAWNEKLDGSGTEVKVSAAYGKKNTTVTRQVVGSSEPGSGSSQLNSQGAQVTAKHSFAMTDKALVSPYVGIRYAQNNMDDYLEGTSTTVTAPLAYSALNTRSTTALAGVGVNYKVNPTITTFASAGIEADTKTSNGSYSGTNSTISGLTAVNFNANPVKVRASAVLGAYYDVEKNQRLAITGIYRQEAYRAVSTTTLLASYTVGL